MTYSISVLFEDWPTDAAGQRPRWNSEIGKLCVSHFFFRAGPGCTKGKQLKIGAADRTPRETAGVTAGVNAK